MPSARSSHALLWYALAGRRDALGVHARSDPCGSLEVRVDDDVSVQFSRDERALQRVLQIGTRLVLDDARHYEIAPSESLND